MNEASSIVISIIFALLGIMSAVAGLWSFSLLILSVLFLIFSVIAISIIHLKSIKNKAE